MSLDAVWPFRGHEQARVDDKGRLKVPNAFRSALEGKYGRELFVTSLTGEDVRIYPMPVWIDTSPEPSRRRSTLTSVSRVRRATVAGRGASVVATPSQFLMPSPRSAGR